MWLFLFFNGPKLVFSNTLPKASHFKRVCYRTGTVVSSLGRTIPKLLFYLVIERQQDPVEGSLHQWLKSHPEEEQEFGSFHDGNWSLHQSILHPQSKSSFSYSVFINLKQSGLQSLFSLSLVSIPLRLLFILGVCVLDPGRAQCQKPGPQDSLPNCVLMSPLQHWHKPLNWIF